MDMDERLLNMPEKTFAKIYGGLLGKLIGVRLGMPIENWKASEVQKEYPHIEGFLDNFDNSAVLMCADDDINGFIFFLRVLENLEDGEQITPQHMADVILNYAYDREENDRSFFWWEDYGAEKLAYRNLTAGISPEESGDFHHNGDACNHIGGQIFYDAIGLVFAGDVERAVRYTEVMSKVMHNGEGAYGGMFVNACISYAFHETEMRTIVEKAVKHIPEHSKFADMVWDMLQFYDNNPYDWKAALYHAEENYPHWHAWDYSALVVLSLLYGNGNFSRTLEICMQCGKDTDCIGGNVGAILGTMVGYQAINYWRWVEPFGDTVFCSSSLNYENEVSITRFTARLLLQACRYGGYEPEPIWKKAASEEHYPFAFPYSNQNFSALLWRDNQKIEDDICRVNSLWTDSLDDVPSGSPYALKFWAWNVKAGDTYEIYRPFAVNEKFEYKRYGSCTYPRLLPGQTVRIKLKTSFSGIWVRLWINGSRDIAPKERILLQENVWTELSMRLPEESYCDYLNIEVYSQYDSYMQNGFNGIVLWLDDMIITGTPSLNTEQNYDFEKDRYCMLKHEKLCFGRISQIDNQIQLSVGDEQNFALTITGQTTMENYQFISSITPLSGTEHLVCFAVHGVTERYAVGFYGENQLALLKASKESFGKYEVLYHTAIYWNRNEIYQFEIKVSETKIEVSINGQKLISEYVLKKLSGAIGFATNGSMQIHSGMKICPVI